MLLAKIDDVFTFHTAMYQNPQRRFDMLRVSHVCAIALLTWLPGIAAAAVDALAWPRTLPVYDHIVIVVEENKDFEQIFGGKFNAPYLKQLAAEGASISRMFGEEHSSESNYFWLTEIFEPLK